MGQKAEKGKREKLPFYQRRGTDLFCKAGGVLAGLMMLAGPFFNWRVVLVRAEENIREGFSIFDMVKKSFSASYGGTANTRLYMAILLFLLELCGIMVLYFAFRDQLMPVKLKQSSSFFNRLIVRFRLIGHLLPLILGVPVLILIHKHPIYQLLYERIEDTYLSWQNLMIGGNHEWKLPGLGCLLFFGGLVLYFITQGLRYLINTLNEDD